MATLILIVWYAAIAARVAAAYRIYHDGLMTRFATVWIYLTISVARSLVLVPLQSDPERYKQAYAYSMPLMLMLQAFAVVGVFWAVAEQYPRFRRTGSVILGCLSGIGICAAWLTNVAAVPEGWSVPAHVLALLERNSVMVMTVVLAGARFFLPRFPGVTVRPSAKRMADILTAYAAVELMSSIIYIANASKFVPMNQLLTVSGGMLCWAATAIFVTKASDRGTEFKPLTDHDEAAMMRAERWFDQLVRMR